jgi:hypothetical protein
MNPVEKYYIHKEAINGMQLNNKCTISPNPIALSKGKAIHLQVRTGPEGSRKLRFPDFKTISK